MKSDFVLAKEELSRIGIVRICRDFYIEPKRRGRILSWSEIMRRGTSHREQTHSNSLLSICGMERSQQKNLMKRFSRLESANGHLIEPKAN